MRCPTYSTAIFAGLINSAHRPVGGRTSPREKLGQPSSSSLSRILEPKQAISNGGRPGLHVDKEQRSNYIWSLPRPSPYDRYDANCTGWRAGILVCPTLARPQHPSIMALLMTGRHFLTPSAARHPLLPCCAQ
ncbi:hypothetical protein HDV64DRAFT_116772 [Trichoderma sp. TUCIM 5745]